VALEATFEDLTQRLLQLRDAIQGLRLTAVEDRPESEAVMLVQQVGDSAEELLGRVQEVFAQADQARHAVGQPLDLNGARRFLTASQEEFMELWGTLFEDFLSYDRAGALLRMALEREPEWEPWVESIRRGVDSCRSAADAVSGAYFHCWQEIAERVGMNSVFVQTTTVGQQVGTT